MTRSNPSNIVPKLTHLCFFLSLSGFPLLQASLREGHSQVQRYGKNQKGVLSRRYYRKRCTLSFDLSISAKRNGCGSFEWPDGINALSPKRGRLRLVATPFVKDSLPKRRLRPRPTDQLPPYTMRVDRNTRR